MEILGIGMPELIFIFIIALIIMGPKDMQKAGRTIGKWLREFAMSDNWKVIRTTSQELRSLPTKLMREANEELGPMNQIGKDFQNPLDTLNMKYPAPEKSKSVILPSPPVSQPPMPEPQSKETESDPGKDA